MIDCYHCTGQMEPGGVCGKCGFSLEGVPDPDEVVSETPTPEAPEAPEAPTPEIPVSELSNNERIKLLARYLRINYLTAKKKYHEMTNKAALELMIEAGREGKTLQQEDEKGPSCPLCNGEMKKRVGKLGPFWGCATYPRCNGLISIQSGITKVTSQQTKDAANKMKATYDFINKIGGVEEAKRWLKIAIQTFNEE